MKTLFISIFILISAISVLAQNGDAATPPTWNYNGNNIYNANSGNVGIGLSNPITKLHITGGFGVSGGLVQTLYPFELITLRTNSNYGEIATHSTQGMDLILNASSQHVGIGVYNPLANLAVGGNRIVLGGNEVSGSYDNDVTAVEIHGAGETGSGYFTIFSDFSTNYKAGFYSNVLPITFSIGNSENMRIENGRVGIGTTNPSSLLDVNGDIRANEIVVNTSGSDFVFEKNYKFLNLVELESYISKYKHLPDIKTADEMQTDGLGLGQFQSKLLQKIEELTLYLIEVNKENSELKEQIEEIKNKLN